MRSRVQKSKREAYNVKLGTHEGKYSKEEATSFSDFQSLLGILVISRDYESQQP